MITKLSTYLTHSEDENTQIAFHNGEVITYSRFKQDVCKLTCHFLEMEQQNSAIYYDQAYPFVVSLFALLHSQKKVFIAANNTQMTADNLLAQDCLLLGEWQGRELKLSESEPQKPYKFTALDSHKQQIIIFTSGSSGQAKMIPKSLAQFETEIETLERYWGDLLGDAQVLATVSHQHIYGLLFRVLWPLASGRCFHSDMYLSPEPLLKYVDIKPAYWVSSPAQLKRLDKLSPWQEIKSLVTVFSSGGELPVETAAQIHQYSGQKVIEIYGSSETGGIAWRQSINDSNWSLFENLRLSKNEAEETLLASPYLSSALVTLDDKIKIINQTQFILLGRADRLVKIEEKRLSLNELEQCLNSSQWVEESHTFMIKAKRDKVVAVIVLSELADDFSQTHKRSQLIKHIRQVLLTQFENVVLPRKWLFMQKLPFTTQGKINQPLLAELLSLDSKRFPLILRCDFQQNSVQLQLKVLAKLSYFSGHFPQQPILPGVTQLAWAEQFGKLFFAIKQPFLRMEVIKFKKIIRPDESVSMLLNWKPETGKLYFEISSETDSHSSGRIVYGEQ